jgi:hypothetical protein
MKRMIVVYRLSNPNALTPFGKNIMYSTYGTILCSMKHYAIIRERARASVSLSLCVSVSLCACACACGGYRFHILTFIDLHRPGILFEDVSEAELLSPS